MLSERGSVYQSSLRANGAADCAQRHQLKNTRDVSVMTQLDLNVHNDWMRQSKFKTI